MQVSDPNIFSTGIINAPEAEIDGFEADIVFAATENLELSLNFAYVDAALSKDYVEVDLEIDASGGTQLPITPEEKGAIGAEYTFPGQILGGDVFIRVDYAYTGESVNSLAGLGATTFRQEPVTQDAFDTLDIKAGWETDKWSTSLYINNVTDEEATLYTSDRWFKRRVSVNEPMTVGFTVRRRFD
ncbi:MAG: outer membrane receptor protein involved in Fe transport [Oceanicoccus sp.]